MYDDAPDNSSGQKFDLVDAKFGQLGDFADDFADIVVVMAHNQYEDYDDCDGEYNAKYGKSGVVCGGVSKGGCVGVVDD